MFVHDHSLEGPSRARPGGFIRISVNAREATELTWEIFGESLLLRIGSFV